MSLSSSRKAMGQALVALIETFQNPDTSAALYQLVKLGAVFDPSNLSDSTAAQENMLTIQDVLLPTLHQHFQLPDASNPTNTIASVYSVLPIQADRSKPVRFPNGHWYLLWMVPVIIKQQYNVELVSP